MNQFRFLVLAPLVIVITSIGGAIGGGRIIASGLCHRDQKVGDLNLTFRADADNFLDNVRVFGSVNEGDSSARITDSSSPAYKTGVSYSREIRTSVKLLRADISINNAFYHANLGAKLKLLFSKFGKCPWVQDLTQY